MLDYYLSEGLLKDREVKLPVPYFTDQKNEYDLLMHGVAIRDTGDNTFLKLTGKDVQDFLHRISTNDLREFEINSVKNTVFCTEKGRIIDRVQVCKTEGSFWLMGNKNRDDVLKRWIQKYIITDDVAIDGKDQLSAFEILGAQNEAFINFKFGDTAGALPANNCTEIEWENHFYLLVKLSDPAKGTYFRIIATPGALKHFITDTLQNSFIFQIGLAGELAYERYRIEKGILSVNELNDAFNPHEAGIIEDVSGTKGCYIGQEVIARLDTYDKVQRQIRKISVEGNLDISSGVQIVDESGNDAGTITSGYFVESDNKTIALAYIRKQFLDGHTKLVTASEQEPKNIRFRNY